MLGFKYLSFLLTSGPHSSLLGPVEELGYEQEGLGRWVEKGEKQRKNQSKMFMEFIVGM